jgi:FdhD protein
MGEVTSNDAAAGMPSLYDSGEVAPVMDPVKRIPVVRVGGAGRAEETDLAAVEEPLEVRLHDRPFAVIMRTPGADCELTAGFLLAEGVLQSPDDLALVAHCADSENVVNVRLNGGSAARLEEVLADRRYVVTNASCGMCGKLTIDRLAESAPRVAGGLRVSPALVAGLPDRLRGSQQVFDETGGLHAAAIVAPDGTLVAVAEDVGRHNAVDKIVGRMLMRDALPLAGVLLVVSGRTSYEIVQKAVIAGIPLVASVSAPSSLAIDLAADRGVTLVGFVRGGRFNIYTHAERIENRALGIGSSTC